MKETWWLRKIFRVSLQFVSVGCCICLDCGNPKFFLFQQIQGFPASIDSKEELCDIVSRIISHLTIQHAVLNYLLADYAEYIPNLPTKLYNDTRVKDGEFSVYRLPNRMTSAVSVIVLNE